MSFLVLWLIVFSYCLLRSYGASEHVGDRRLRKIASVVGVVAAVNVPIVIYSIKLLSHAEQLHPEVVAKQGLADPRFVYALVLSIVAVFFLSTWLFIVQLTNRVLWFDVRQKVIKQAKGGSDA